MSLILTVEIPALDRLCGILESQDKSDLVRQIEEEIVAKLKEAAEGGVPRPKFEEVPVAEDHPWKDEATSPELEPEGPRTEPELKPKPKPANDEARGAITLDAVQRAAAQLRDAGKLKAVTDLFPEFGIKKLSDLEGEQLAAFAERLRKLGARV